MQGIPAPIEDEEAIMTQDGKTMAEREAEAQAHTAQRIKEAGDYLESQGINPSGLYSDIARADALKFQESSAEQLKALDERLGLA